MKRKQNKPYCITIAVVPAMDGFYVASYRPADDEWDEGLALEYVIAWKICEDDGGTFAVAITTEAEKQTDAIIKRPDGLFEVAGGILDEIDTIEWLREYEKLE